MRMKALLPLSIGFALAAGLAQAQTLPPAWQTRLVRQRSTPNAIARIRTGWRWSGYGWGPINGGWRRN